MLMLKLLNVDIFKITRYICKYTETMKRKPNYNVNNVLPGLLVTKPYDGFLALFKSKHTLENYQQDLRVLKKYFDDLNIRDIRLAKPENMMRFAGSLTKIGITPSGKPRLAYSTRSMKRILATTRSFFRYLASIQNISNDPTAVFHNLDIRSPQRNPRPLSPKDRLSLVQSLKTENISDIKVSLTILLGYHCGLRVSEITQLRWKDIDLDRMYVTVIGKGDKERIVPITESIQKLFRLHMDSKSPSCPFLFPSPRDEQKPIHPDYVESWVKKAAHWANLENSEEMTVHVLRHTFGTQLAESGASVYEIRDLMGHSSIMVSENYVKLASTKARQAHQKAFEPGYQVHALSLADRSSIAIVLKRFRSFRKNGIPG
jgi:site-specific recombinase XerD